MKLKGWLGQPKLAMPNELNEDCPTYDDYAANTESRTCAAILIDQSFSMLTELPELKAAFEDLLKCALANLALAKVLDLAVIGISGDRAQVLQPFDRLTNIRLPELVAAGETPLYGGVLLAVELIEGYQEKNARRGIDMRPPMVIVITDGKPTDEENKLAAITKVAIYEGQPVRGNRIGFFFFTTTGGNMEQLQKLSKRKVERVTSGSFRGVMDWILASLDSVTTKHSVDESDFPKFVEEKKG